MPGRGLLIRPDPWAKRLAATTPATPLPAWVDLRGWVAGRTVSKATPVGPVRNQGEKGACVAFATTSLLMALRVAAGAPYLELSADDLYYQTRVLEGDPNTDSGSDPGDALQVCLVRGVTPNDDVPYSDQRLNPTEGADAAALAYAYRLGTRQQVPDYATAKQVLAGGSPVTVCVPAYTAWDNTGADGVIPGSIVQDASKGANHCVCLVGYWEGYALLQNQWGSTWGWQGIGCLPEPLADAVLSYMWTGTL